jgi:hypothetical protein
MIVCQCGSTIVKPGGGVIACRRCGVVSSVPRDTAIDLPCIHKGKVVGVADCGCGGNLSVWHCGIHGFCMKRKIKPGRIRVSVDGQCRGIDMAYCTGCPQEIKAWPTIQPGSTAIITTHYNPAGFTRLRETWREWQPTIGEVITIELVIGGESEIPGSVAIHGNSDNVLWQKERLINLAIEQLPSGVRTVAWVDHDIVFEDQNWLVESQRMIDAGLDAVQPFTTVKYQGRDGRVERTAKSAASVAIAGDNPSTGPGAAWVASRDWLQSIGGLYDRNIVGGGDATFFEAVSKQRTKYRERQSDASQRHLGRWVESVGPVRYGCLPGAVRHLWHGDFANRQYVSRDAILRRFEFDPDKHVEIDSNGLLAWTVAASPEFRAEVAAYFAGRREDG